MTALHDKDVRAGHTAVWSALGTVRDPELDEPLTDLGFVADVFGQFLFDGAFCFGEGQAPDIQTREEMKIDFAVRSNGCDGFGSWIIEQFDFQFIAGSKGKEFGRRLKPVGIDAVGLHDGFKRDGGHGEFRMRIETRPGMLATR